MTRPHRRSLLWQSACILLPLLLLAGLALWQLGHGRKLALSQARDVAERFVARAAPDLIPEIEPLRDAGHEPLARPIDGAAEPGGFLYSLAPIPTPMRAPYQEFLKALECEKAATEQGSTSTAERALASKFTAKRLREILHDYPGGFTDAGLPLAPLVRWELARLAEFDLASLRIFLRCAVETHPSLFTPELLRRASDIIGSSHPLIEEHIEKWHCDEYFRAALRSQSATINGLKSSDWIVHVSEITKGSENSQRFENHFWANIVGRDVALIDEHTLREQASASIDKEAALLPDHLGVAVWLRDHLLFDRTDGNERLAVLERGPWRIAVGVADRRALLASVHAQTNVSLIAIVVATVAALVGLFALRRSYARQIELGEMKSDFVASVSHELRAPVASVRLLAERLRAGKVTDDTKREEYFGYIEGEARRLGALVENVLDFSRIERGSKEYQFSDTDLAALVRDTVGVMTPYAAERGIILKTEIPAEDAHAEADAAELRQALVNLIDNAIKFAPKESAVTVGLDAQNGDACLWVRDPGPGVAAADRTRIFERFYRSGSELTRETQGVGIGLSIVQHIAEGHGGRAEFEPAPGGGSRFSITIPTKQPHG